MLSFILLFDVIMKNSGKCPKCGSDRIWNSKNIKLLGQGRGVYVSVTSWRAIRLVPYICLDCGYSELNCDDHGIEIIEKHAMKKQDLWFEKKCPICGAKVSQNAQVCDECGSILE
jgi:predicted nucleic-acid-binding Zn-ribbon protein